MLVPFASSYLSPSIPVAESAAVSKARNQTPDYALSFLELFYRVEGSVQLVEVVQQRERKMPVQVWDDFLVLVSEATRLHQLALTRTCLAHALYVDRRTWVRSYSAMIAASYRSFNVYDD
jgi:hypothetical protein